MKILTLEGDIYKKFFAIADKIQDNLQTDVSLMNISMGIERIMELVSKAGNFAEGEMYGRAMHYAILDNMGVISQYLDTSKEVTYLQSTRVGIFEIVTINKNSVIFLDISTGKEFEIIGEGEGSQFRLEKDFSEGDLVISRLIQLDDGWYNMKNFYFLTTSSLDKKDFDNAKIAYKQIFYGVKDMLDIEKKMDMINFPDDVVKTDANYLKRLKNLLLKLLGKKKYKMFEKILKNGNDDALEESLKMISQLNMNQNDRSVVQEYIISFLNENVTHIGTKSDKQLGLRLQLTVNNFLEYLQGIGKEVSQNKKLSQKEIEELETLKIEWFNTKNPLYSNKTPLEFIHEIDADYGVADLVMQQFSPEELEFYDGYEGCFTQEEDDIYAQALEKAKKQDLDSYKGFEKLMKNHGDFFRLRANYIMIKYHYILDKYLNENNKDYTYSSEELIEDKTHAETIYTEIEYVKKLKPDYIFSNGFEGLVDKMNDNLLIIIGMKKGDDIFNDAGGIYDDILIYDANDNCQCDYKKIDEFIKKINKLFVIFDKQYVLQALISNIESDMIELPDYILKNIEDRIYSKKFKKIIEDIGYKWGKYDN